MEGEKVTAHPRPLKGSIHDLEEVIINDQRRQELLEKDGLTILRFTNEEILTKLEDVICCIKHQITNQKSYLQ